MAKWAHTGFKAVSTGGQGVAHVIADLIRNPEGWMGNSHAEYLLDTTVAQARTGFKAVSTGWGDKKTNQPESPSPLMGEESKVRVKTMHQHRYNPENPDSKIQNAAGHHAPSLWT